MFLSRIMFFQLSTVLSPVLTCGVIQPACFHLLQPAGRRERPGQSSRPGQRASIGEQAALPKPPSENGGAVGWLRVLAGAYSNCCEQALGSAALLHLLHPTAGSKPTLPTHLSGGAGGCLLIVLLALPIQPVAEQQRDSVAVQLWRSRPGRGAGGERGG